MNSAKESFLDLVRHFARNKDPTVQKLNQEFTDKNQPEADAKVDKYDKPTSSTPALSNN